MDEERSAFKILKGKPTEKMGKNTRRDLEEIGINGGNWVDSVQDRDY